MLQQRQAMTLPTNTPSTGPTLPPAKQTTTAKVASQNNAIKHPAVGSPSNTTPLKRQAPGNKKN